MPNHLQDGFSTTISFSLNPGLAVWERRLKPPALDGTGPIEEATMYSVAWRVRSPKSLATLTEMNFTAAYRVQVYTAFFAIMQRIGVITITFSDGSTLAYYGWYDKFDPQELTEGESPNAVITAYASMQSDEQGGFTEMGITIA